MKCPAISLVRPPARWWGSYFGIRGFFSLWLSRLQLMKGPARGEDKSTTKTNHPLDALAITPVPVNYHSLWLTELWALRAGSSPADVIAITILFLTPLLLNAWPKVFCEWFPAYVWQLMHRSARVSCLCLSISIKSCLAFLCLFLCLLSGIIDTYLCWKVSQWGNKMFRYPYRRQIGGISYCFHHTSTVTEIKVLPITTMVVNSFPGAVVFPLDSEEGGTGRSGKSSRWKHGQHWQIFFYFFDSTVVF